MTVDTGGPIRGLIGRWLMRIQAAQGILSLTFQATTAVSALSGVLAYTGYQRFVPHILAVGVLGGFVFAYAYVEFGLYNRKNRENVDRGNNFATPRDRIDDTLIGAGVFGAVHGRPPDDEELAAIAEAVERPWEQYRDGVDLEVGD